jgi:hypothetical protein
VAGSGIRRKTWHYNGPQNLDSVISYTWEQKRGGPSGKFKAEIYTVV